MKISLPKSQTSTAKPGLSFLHYLLWLIPVLALFLPSVLSLYYLRLLNDIGIYAILGLSLNLILGQTGLFNMGHAAFFAIGAYTTAILNLSWQIPILWTMPIAGVMAAMVGVAVARPIVHLRGDYLLIVTIGIVEIVRIILANDVFGLTGGENGLFGIARPVFWGLEIRTEAHFFYLIWFFVGLALLFFYSLEHSRFGRALNYIKDDEVAAAGIGVKTIRYKLAAFSIGAFWAGMCGTIFAARMSSISPGSFTFSESVLLFAIVILGGSGNIWGVLLGSALIIGLPELFRDLQSSRMLVFGAAMVLMMLFRPQGILPPRHRVYDASSYVGRFPKGIASAPGDLSAFSSPAAEHSEQGDSKQ